MNATGFRTFPAGRARTLPRLFFLTLALLSMPLALLAQPAQTITPDVVTLPDRDFALGTFFVGATASSGLPVEYSIFAGNATIDPATGEVTPTGTGEVTVQYDQAGNGTWDPAPSVQQSFFIKESQNLTPVTLPPAIVFTTSNDFALNYGASSGLLPVYTLIDGPVELTGNIVNINGTLDVATNTSEVISVEISQPGNDFFFATPTLTLNIPIQKAALEIANFSTFVELEATDTGETFSAYAVDLSVQEVAPISVEYFLIEEFTLNEVLEIPGVARIDGSNLVVLGAGEVTVRARVAAVDNPTYLPDVEEVLITIARSSQTVTFDTPATPTFNGVNVILSASSSSGLEVQFEITSGANRATLFDNPAIVNANETLVPDGGAGTVVVRAIALGNNDFLDSDPVEQVINILPATQEIVFSDATPTQVAFGEFPFRVEATSVADPGAPIEYSVETGPGILSDGNLLTPVGPGQILVAATQAGTIDDNGDSIPDYLPGIGRISIVAQPVNTTTGPIYLDRWTIRNPEPVGEFLEDIIFAGGQYVAVGDDGRVQVSNSGAEGDWSIEPSGITANLNGIAYDGSVYVVVGEGGEIWTDADAQGAWTQTVGAGPASDLNAVFYDGTTFIAVGADGGIWTVTDPTLPWTQQEPGLTTETLNDVLFGDGRYIAVGDSGTILTSFNAVDWDVEITGIAQNLNDVYYDDTRDIWVVVGGAPGVQQPAGTLFTSTDGVNWTAQFSTTTFNLNTVVDGNGFLLALGDRGKVLYSLDGIAWIESTARFLYDFRGSVFANGFFHAVGSGFAITSTPSGQVWSILESSANATLNGVAYNGTSLFLAVGDNGRMLASSDGETWVDRVSGTAEDLRGVAFDDGGRAVVVGGGGTILYSDNDGLTWTPATGAPLGGLSFNDVTFAGGQFVAVGDGFRIATSPDGDNWTVRTSGTGTSLNGVFYAAAVNTYVAVGEAGTILLSPDGIEWTSRFSGTTAHLHSVSYSPQLERFVAVGAEGKVIFSRFGDDWTPANAGTIYDIYGIAYLPDEIGDEGTFVAVGQNYQILSSRDGIEWSQQLGGTLNDLRQVAVGGGTFVAVGEHEAILSTTTAVPTGLDDWVHRSPTPDALDLNEIFFARDTYVGVGANGTILTSTDGEVWIARDSGTLADLRGVTFGNNQFVAVGEQAILTSVDGVDWDLQTTWLVPLNDVSYLNGIFVAVGDDGLLITSPDGLEWTNRDTNVNNANLYSVSFGNGQFIAVGENSRFTQFCDGSGRFESFDATAITVSSDGINWSRKLPPVIGFTILNCPIYVVDELYGVEFGNNQFVMVGERQRIMSWNGDFDTEFGLEDVKDSGNLRDIAYGDGNGEPRFVVVGDAGALLTSTDGFEYEIRFPGVTENLSGTVYGGGQFLVVGDNGRILTSPNGASWVALRSSGFVERLDGAAYNGALVAIGGQNGRILTSPDGVNWTERVSGTTDNINAMAFGRGTYIAVANSGVAITSADGLTWNAAFSGQTTNDLLDIAFGDELFVAVGRDGTILTTDDGDPWVLRASPALGDITGVVFGDDRFVAVATQGQFLVSDDGKDWRMAANPPAGFQTELTGVAYGNGFFTAVGRFGRVVTSPDGETWTLQDSRTSVTLNDVFFGDGIFVAVGLDGTVITSVNGNFWDRRPTTTSVTLFGGVFADGLYLALGNFGTVIASGELVIKQDQTIFFPEITESGRVATDSPPIGLLARASSGLPVTYRVISDPDAAVQSTLPVPFALSSDIVVLSGNPGNVTIEASQPGNRFFNAAPPVTQSFTVQASNQDIEFLPFASHPTPPSLPLTFGNPPVFVVATAVQEATTTPTNLPVIFTVEQGRAEIIDQVYLDQAPAVGGPFEQYLGFSVGTSIATVRLTGASDLIVINAEQFGDPTFSPSTATFEFTVDKATPEITFAPDVTGRTVGDPIPLVAVATNPNLPGGPELQVIDREVQFRVDPPSEIIDNVFIPREQGDITVEAFLPGDDDYFDAVPVTVTFDVGQAATGTSWIDVSTASPSTSNLNGVDQVGEFFVATGDNVTILTSLTGQSWTNRATGSFALRSTAFGNGLYVAVGDSAIVYTSSDAINWNASLTPITGNLNAVAFGNLRFVAVGPGGNLITSPNGISWTAANTTLTSNLNDVTYFNGRFVAVGDGGVTGYSSDGDNWTFTQSTTADLNGVTSGNGIYVAVGDGSTVLRSTDGITWGASSSPVDSLNAVAFGRVGLQLLPQFVAVGDGGVIATSSNGQAWTVRDSATTTDLNSVTFLREIFVAVGDDGTILVSGAAEGRESQSIDVQPVPPVTFGEVDVLLDATSLDIASNPTGLPIDFAVVAGAATVDNAGTPKTFTPTAAGNITLRAFQDGDSTYLPAAPIDIPVMVAPANQTITFDPPGPLGFGDAPVALSADVVSDVTGEPTGLPLIYSVTAGNGVVDGNGTLTITGEGPIDIQITQAGDMNYNPASLNVTVNVTGTLPRASLLSPQAGEQSSVGSAILLLASASDTGTNAGIASVDFEVDGINVGTATQLPGTSLWYLEGYLPPSAGTVTFAAVATDNDGLTATSAERDINITDAAPIGPTITLDPVGNASVNQEVPLTANVSPGASQIASVEFIVNGESIATLTTSPFTAIWEPEIPGTYWIYARAEEVAGNITDSIPQVVVVTAPPVQAPRVAITAPNSGSLYQLGTNYSLQATAQATAANATIDSVVFEVDREIVGNATILPGTSTWYLEGYLPDEPGTIDIVAIATDSAGNSTRSATLTFVVNDASPLPPTITLNPLFDLPLGTSQFLIAEAFPGVSQIDRVDFFVNGELIESVSEAPYQTLWAPEVSGNHIIYTRVREQNGNLADSTPQVVNVGAATLPNAFTVQVPNNVGLNVETTLLAEVTDDDHLIERVDFYVNGVLINSDSGAPYVATWLPRALGEHQIFAIAHNVAGGALQSAIETVDVTGFNGLPQIAITHPVGFATDPDEVFTPFVPITIESITTNIGGEPIIQYYVNDGLVSVASDPPFQADWEPSGTGTFEIRAGAFLNGELVATSEPVTIQVDSPITPDLSMVTPLDGTTAQVGDIVSLQAVPVGLEFSGPIAYFVNDVLVGNSDTAPFIVDYQPIGPGTYSIVARAGGFSSQPIFLNVVDAPTPSVSITAPDNDATFTVGTDIVLGAEAIGTGNPLTVFFYANGNLIGSSSDFPFRLSWTPASIGNYTLTAKVIEQNRGVSPTSAPINVQIVPPEVGDPAIIVTNPLDGQTFRAGSVVRLQAALLNPVGRPLVGFFINGQQVTDSLISTFPFEFDWTPPGSGDFEISARLYFEAFPIPIQVADSNERDENEKVVVRVFNGEPPSVAITGATPSVGNTAFIVNEPVTLSVQSSDTDGTIRRLQLFEADAQGERIGGAINTLFAPQGATNFNTTFTFTPTEVRDYYFVAGASDELQNEIDSEPFLVKVTVSNPPSVAILAPADDLSIPASVNSTLEATATDIDGTVERMFFEVFHNDLSTPVLATNATITPGATVNASVDFSSAQTGDFFLRVTAIDNDDDFTTSTLRRFFVINSLRPTISLSRTNTDPLIKNSPIDLQADVADPDGDVAYVEFFVQRGELGDNLELVANVSLAPGASDAQASYLPPIGGTYTFYAIAIDDTGERTRSDDLTFMVENSFIEIAQPLDGTTFAVLTPITIRANAFDIGQTIQSVVFSIGGGSQIIGEATTFPYTVTFTPPSVGSYQIIATATNSANGATDSTPVNIDVVANASPNVTLLPPSVGNNTFTIGESGGSSVITLQANANDPDGTIQDVTFFGNTILLGTAVGTNPYAVIHAPPSTGNLSIVAEARDDVGNRVASSPMILDIVPPVGFAPEVSLLYPQSPEGGNPTFTTQSNTIILAGVNDGDGDPVSVSYYINGTFHETVTTFPFASSWSPTTSGVFRIVAIAEDGNGNRVSSFPITTVVNSSFTQPPIFNNFGVDTDPIVLGDVFRLQAEVVDPDGVVAQVQFFSGSSPAVTENDGIVTQASSGNLYELDVTALAAGTYYFHANATDSSGNIVSSGLLPITVDPDGSFVRITSPAANATLVTGESATLTARAGNVDGEIDTVELYAQLDGGAAAELIATLDGISGVANYSTNWRPAQPGTYQLFARAISGQEVEISDSVTVLVTGSDLRPQVSITRPLNGGSAAIVQPITLQARALPPAANPTIPVALVEFFANGISVGVDAASPYTVEYTPVSLGQVSIVARAVDIFGASRTSEPVVIDIIESRPPTVDLVYPRDGVTYTLGSPIPFFARASDAEGSVTGLRFFVDGVPILGGAITEPPFEVLWGPDETGTYRITAEATDDAGNVGTSNEVTISIAAPLGEAPSVGIFTPTPQDEPLAFTTNSRTIFLAGATDDSTTGLNVEYYVNGLPLALDSSFSGFPYPSVSWKPNVGPGFYHVVAEAIDADGNRVVSPDRLFDVSGSLTQGPIITLEQPIDPNLGQPVTLRAQATDVDGVVTQVQFYSGSVPAVDSNNGIVTTPSNDNFFELPLAPEFPGTYYLTAVATDDSSNTTRSLLRVMTVSAVAFFVDVTTPQADASFSTGDQITLSARAGDFGSSIDQVAFFYELDGGPRTAILSPLTTPDAGTTGNYSLNWRPVLPGNYTIIAEATNGDSDTMDSTPVPLNVTGADLRPRVSISAPADGSFHEVNLPLQVRASASPAVGDPTATIASVQFLLNGIPIGDPDTTVPYTVSFNPTATGNYRLSATATDIFGESTTSEEVIVTVMEPGAPMVTLTNPQDGSQSQVGTTLILAATATTEVGNVASVEFFVNGLPVPITEGVFLDTVEPFTTNFVPATTGNYTIFARATNNLGEFTNSAPVTVQVTTTRPYDLALAVDNNASAGSDILVEALIPSPGQEGAPERAIGSVQFFVDGQPIGENGGVDENEPFSVFWTPASAGTYTLSAVSVDTAGTQAFAQTEVTVQPRTGQIPSVTLAITADGNVTPGSRVMVSAVVFDDEPTLPTLSFFLNGAQIPADQLLTPTSLIIQPEISGSGFFRNWELRVLAEDGQGNSRGILQDQIYISDFSRSLPNIEITTPSLKPDDENILVTAGLPQTLSAEVSGTGATDVQSVIFYIDGVEIGTARTAPYKITWLPELSVRSTDPLYFEEAVITAAFLRSSESFDHDQDEFTTDIDVTPVQVSNPVTVRVRPDVPGLPPVVSITAPEENSILSAGEALTVEATVQPDIGKVISQVEFFQTDEIGNTTSLGIVTDSSLGVYSLETTPQAPGTFQLFATATDSSGTTGTSPEVSVQVVIGGVPQITSFTSDLVGTDLLVGTPITFTVTAEDEDGIDRIELRRNGSLIVTDTTDPYELTDTPTAPGTFSYLAEVVNVNGTRARSSSITITVRDPDPVNVEADFVYQSFFDLLFRVFTEEERSFYVERIEGGDIDRARLVNEIFNLEEYQVVRDTIMIDLVLTGVYPWREDLVADVATVRDAGYINYAEILLPEFWQRFYGTTEPAISGTIGEDSSNDTIEEQRDVMEKLFFSKYLILPTIEQSDAMINGLRQLALGDFANFVSIFVQDNLVTGTANLQTAILRIPNPPANSLERRADAAALLINLLRIHPTNEEVEALAALEFFAQVEQVIADPRYSLRFIFSDSVELGNAWKWSPWIGFYYDEYYPWLYQNEHGWIYVVGTSSDNLWIYSTGIEWTWTNRFLYPYLWRANDTEWILYELDTANPRRFWVGNDSFDVQ